MNMRLGILGGGRAAWAYGLAWKRIGWPLTGVWLRDESTSRIAELLSTARLEIGDVTAESEILLIAVSDRAIEEVASRIPETEALIFHASGALPSLRGGFSLHPLRTLPPVGTPVDLAGVPLVFEGAHRRTAKLIATAIGGRFAEVSAEMKPLYHAAAVFGSNYVAACLDIAERLMRESGVTGVREDLANLARSAIENWTAHTDAARFTGPAARGDEAIMGHHREALERDPELRRLYDLLAEQIVSGLKS
jgi:predicted short-subunit dehydrogenase-like oxidoreductase (DUF2520 family)